MNKYREFWRYGTDIDTSEQPEEEQHDAHVQAFYDNGYYEQWRAEMEDLDRAERDE